MGGGGEGWGIRVDVNEELKFLGKFTKNAGEGGSGGGVGLVVGDVNNVGGRGDVGYGRCEPRIEGIVQCTKLHNIKKIKKMWRGEGQYLNPKHSL